MDIKTSLVIERKESGKINLILSGSFVKVYNQSFYILTEIIGRKLKAKAGYVKSADNQFVVSGGLPAQRVMEQYPHAIKTNWGYQITGAFDTNGYLTWLLRQESAAKAVGDAVMAVLTPCPEEFGQGSTPLNPSQAAQKTIIPQLSLTEQQHDYLKDWQRGNYPIEVDLGFIESLKQQLIKTPASSD